MLARTPRLAGTFQEARAQVRAALARARFAVQRPAEPAAQSEPQPVAQPEPVLTQNPAASLIPSPEPTGYQEAAIPSGGSGNGAVYATSLPDTGPTPPIEAPPDSKTLPLSMLAAAAVLVYLSLK